MENSLNELTNSTEYGTMISDNQKRIYNLYLKAYRINNNSPFKAKKNFDDIEENLEIRKYLEKLEAVFRTYPSFFSERFFDAPYKLYDEEKPFYSLKFYSSQKGLTTCIAYFKSLMLADPETQFDFFRGSYKFIAEFCIEKGIELGHYTQYCSVAQRDCLKHLKEHKISWYIVMSFPKFFDLVYDMPEDEFALYYGTDVDLFAIRNNYLSSKKTQIFLSELHTKVRFFIENSLKKNQK